MFGNAFQFTLIKEEGGNASLSVPAGGGFPPNRGISTNWVMLTPNELPNNCREVSLKEAGVIS